MIKNYVFQKRFQSTLNIRKAVSRYFYSSTIFLALTLFSFVSSTANAQATASFTFDTGTQGWSSSGGAGSFLHTTAQTCGSGGALYANVYYGYSTNLISQSLGQSSGATVNMSFDYKVVEYGTYAAAPSSEMNIVVQWSNVFTGPYTTFYTVNSASHTSSSNCATKTASFTPNAGPVYVKIISTSIGEDSDLYFFYDNIIFTEGLPSSCGAPTAIVVPPASLNQTGFTLNWSAPSTAPSLGYEYEVRSSGVAGSGAAGLAASGSTAAGITTATVTGLLSGTSYNVFVRAKCSAAETSGWAVGAGITTVCGVSTIPYVMPFESANVPELPTCVPMENINNDNKFWKTASSTADISGKVMQYTYNVSEAADDWFYTAPLNLTAGINYRLSFKYKVTTYEEKLKVAVGSSANATAMTQPLIDLTIPSNTTGGVLQELDFTVATTGVYNVGFQEHSDANKNSLYVGEISIIVGPTCLPPTGLIVTNLDKNSATIAWEAASTIPANGYSFEVRTSGAAGSGATGLAASGTTAAGIVTADLSGLVANTEYNVYVSSNCSTTDLSAWTAAVKFRTLCDYLEIVAVNDSTCLGSTATLQVTGATTEVSWFETDSSLEVLEEGPVFETPELLATTSYWAQVSSVSDDINVQVGAGASVAESYQNPFYSLWSNNHTQHIILASELVAAGLLAGPINSVALTVTNNGSLPMLDLTVKIGTTTAVNMAEFVDNSAFSVVYTSPSLMPVNGLNTLAFSTPFVWDGTSNIVLEFCHGNPSSTASMYRTVLADATSYPSSVKSHSTSSTSGAASCAMTTTAKISYSLRPLFTFKGASLCIAPSRTEVVATVNDIPVITADNVQTVSVDAAEDATLADLEPFGANINWFATEADAIAFTNELEIASQLNSGTTYYAVLTEDDCRSLPFAVLVTVTLGLENQTMNGLTYYPNPVQDRLNISYSENITSVVLYNLVGQKVMEIAPNATNFILDTSKLSVGTYMIQVKAETASKTIKLIKK